MIWHFATLIKIPSHHLLQLVLLRLKTQHFPTILVGPNPLVDREYRLIREKMDFELIEENLMS